MRLLPSAQEWRSGEAAIMYNALSFASAAALASSSSAMKPLSIVGPTFVQFKHSFIFVNPTASIFANAGLNMGSSSVTKEGSFVATMDNISAIKEDVAAIIVRTFPYGNLTGLVGSRGICWRVPPG